MIDMYEHKCRCGGTAHLEYAGYGKYQFRCLRCGYVSPARNSIDEAHDDFGKIGHAYVSVENFDGKGNA